MLGSIGVVISVLIMQWGKHSRGTHATDTDATSFSIMTSVHWTFLADPICGLMISVLILMSAIPLIWDTAKLLMQRTPLWAERYIQLRLKMVQNIPGILKNFSAC